MATSTYFGWAEPDDTDLVKNGASAMRTLGNAIDATVYTTNYFAGKNKIINGDFGIWQRGTTTSVSVATNTFIADRWVSYRNGTGGTVTASQQTFTAGTAPVSGYEGTYFFRYAKTVGGSSGTYDYPAFQRIEDTRIFAGQTVTISFWAKADATRAVRAYYSQNFGSGGSSAVTAESSDITISTSWARYSATFSIPSISGKTIGTSSSLEMGIVAYNTNATFTIDLWGVQLEAGSTATPFQTATGTKQGELAACQRYYYRATAGAAYGLLGTLTGSTTGIALGNVKFPLTMRVIPTTLDTSAMNTFYWESGANNNNTPTAITLGGSCSNTVGQLYITATSKFVQGAVYDLFGNNNATAYVGFSAEL